MGDKGAGGDMKVGEEVSEVESFVSDAESHELKVPCMGHVSYLRCACVFKVLLWTLVASFQAIPLGWIVLMASFFSQSSSFITWLLNPGIGLCGSIEIIFSAVITALALVQLLQKGKYSFVHKCRVIFNVILAAFLSHLLVFFGLSFVVYFNFPKRMHKEMKRELHAFTKRGKGLHEHWELAQEKYKCCGFGGEEDYGEGGFPLTCCPLEERFNCTQDTRWLKNCFFAEQAVGKHFMRFGIILLGTAIPFACLFYLGFRYFRPYWTVERHSKTTLRTQRSSEVSDNVEGESDDDDGSDNRQRRSTALSNRS